MTVITACIGIGIAGMFCVSAHLAVSERQLAAQQQPNCYAQELLTSSCSIRHSVSVSTGILAAAALCVAHRYEVDSFEQLAGADARKVILFLAVMAVHAVGEGGGVGVSFAGDRGWAQVSLWPVF